MKKLKWLLTLGAGVLIGGLLFADAVPNPVTPGALPVAVSTQAVPIASTWLITLCSKVDCLNNFTGKTGYSFSAKQELSGGFTDLETSWYVSPAPGFEVPTGPSGAPFLDVNAVFKVGKLLSDKIPVVHNLVNSDPFASGLLNKLVVGESGGYDYTHGKWFDLSWVGATFNFQ